MKTGNTTIDRTNSHHTILTANNDALDSKNPFKDLSDTPPFRDGCNDIRNDRQEDDGVPGEVISDLARLAPFATQYGPTVEAPMVPHDKMSEIPNDALGWAVGRAL
jgi:hypothetical protein